MLIDQSTAIQYIKDDLGLGIVNLEVDDETIIRNLNRGLMTMASYYTAPTYKTVAIELTTGTGGYIPISDIDPDGVGVITAVYPTDNVLKTDAALLGLGTMYLNIGQALDMQITQYANMINKLSLLESILGRNARVVGDKLYVDHYYSNVTVAYIPKKLTIEKIEDGDWLKWLLEYATALSKRQLAQTRGKYIITSNPATTNAASLLEEANSAITALEEALSTKGILITTR